MTRNERIIGMAGLPAHVVAAAVGCSEGAVHGVRFRHRNPEAGKAYTRKWRTENRERHLAYQREVNLRTKRTEGRRSWSEKDKKRARSMLAAGKSFTEVAAVFGVSRSAVAGLSRRMREAGL